MDRTGIVEEMSRSDTLEGWVGGPSEPAGLLMWSSSAGLQASFIHFDYQPRQKVIEKAGLKDRARA